MNHHKNDVDSLYKINRYTGEFVCSKTESIFIDLSWPGLSRKLLIIAVLGSITYFFASCIPRPEVNPEYRAFMVPITRVVAGFILVIALIVKNNHSYSIHLCILIVLAEISIGLLESADQYFYLKSINKFYDIGTSFLVFYILIFYIIIPNRIKLTLFTSIGVSLIFIISVYLTETAAFSDLFTTIIYFVITNCLGYGILLTTNRAKREEYHHVIQLKKAEQEAQEANKEKSRFLAIMNHEMRTPLNVVLGGIQILNNSSLTTEQENITSIIQISGELLRVLIQNILDFTNIERNKLQLRVEQFSLKQVIEESDKIYSHISEEKGLDFFISNNCATVENVVGDSMRLRQILSNLLNNAVKFTTKGSVSLSIDLIKKEENNILLRFSVSDTGIGIPKEHFGYIVQPFTQVEQSLTRNFDGSGLGLAICSELLNCMDSRLEIASEVGSGSTFSFDLFLAINSDEYLKAEEPVIDSYRILLIDDIEANLKIVGGLLETFNQRVVCALGSRQGIEKSLLDDFDAVIIDLHMPEKNGIETIREIKMRHPDIATFLMTADTRDEVFTDFLKAGFTDFIPKPVDVTQLKNALGKIGSVNPVISKSMAIVFGSEEIIDMEFIRELKNDLDNKVFIDVIKSCVETLKKDVLRINNLNCVDGWKYFIHQLKGVAGNYRLMRLWNFLEGYKSDLSTLDSNQLKKVLDESIVALNNEIDLLLTL
ncbi:MAG: response regulator [Spirochaetales bacterium]|nr:response regulator [Spirochaetales bacterium]